MNIIDLPWLLPAPPDFRQRCKELENDDSCDYQKLRQLADHALDINQLSRLSKTIDKVLAITSGPSVRLALLSNATTDFLAPALTASAARHGIFLDVVEVPFGQAMQAVLDPDSVLNSSPVDLALLAFDQRLIAPVINMSDGNEADDVISAALAQLTALRQGLHKSGVRTNLVQTLPHAPAFLTGSFDRYLPGSPGALISSFNSRLLEDLNDSEDILFDVAGLAGQVGQDLWHDPTLWNLAKLSFSQSVVPLYADHVARVIGAFLGKSRKCLVLDLDNTLWGGVIGDDGLDGIVIGQGDSIGEAHLEIQRTAKQLNTLGIILAVSSKNEDETARLPFRKHPDMILKESDIAIFQANWQDKATNVQAIAKALDIGLDSLVLLDDNPAERAQVRDALPDVAVPELPDDPALFSRYLLSAGYFETLGLSDEDLLRAKDYAARAERIQLQDSVRDLGTYLASLDMEIELKPFDGPSRTRIAQLINKSNQFNLTTRRYSEAQVKEMESESGITTLQARLTDRFGDNGMISVIICREHNEAWEIDTWLMSCRVLGRRVEEAILNALVISAKRANKRSLIGRYISSGRNDLVRDHYKKLGFSLIDKNDQETLWQLDIENFTLCDLPMRVKGT